MTVIEITYSRPYPILLIPKPWTTGDLAKRLGTSNAAVSHWRQGTGRPTRERLTMALTALYPRLTMTERMVIGMAYGYLPESLEAMARRLPSVLADSLGVLEEDLLTRSPSSSGGDDFVSTRPGVRPYCGPDESDGEV